MSRPRPTPPTPTPLDESQEFERPDDHVTLAGGPREFAKLTNGSATKFGKSRIITPDPN